MNKSIFEQPNYDKKISQIFSKGVHEYFMKVKAKNLISFAKNFDIKTLLDIGCGTGEFASLIHQHFDRIIGIDSSKQMIKAAKAKKIKNCNFLLKNATDFKLDQKFDLVILVNVLHHVDIKNQSKVLKNARMHLKKGGHIIVFEHNPFNPYVWVLVNHIALVDKDAVMINHLRLGKWLKKTGFCQTQTKFIKFFPKQLSFMQPFERYLSAIPFGGGYMLIART